MSPQPPASAAAVSPAAFSVLSLLQNISVASIEAEIEQAEKLAPFALAFLPADERAKIASAASFVMGICASLGGTIPQAQPQPAAGASGGAP